MSIARRGLLISLAIAGLALYLWPALAAPPVLFSDSVLDLEWAQSGAGIWKPIGELRGDAALHPAKPGYLLFLRAAMNAVPRAGHARSVVLTQSLLLWGSLAATSLYVGRRKSLALGIALYVTLVLFLRLRDSASQVMSEAISAAGFLPLTALFLCTPRRLWPGLFLGGAGAAALFWIRPNVGLAALLMAAIAVRPWRGLVFLGAGFLAIALPVGIITRPAAADDALRGLAHPVFAATAEYYWLPSLGKWPEGTGRERAAEEFRLAAANWKTLLSRRDVDARREIVWRGLAGFFGTEFYDARWSAAYRRLTVASRIAAPFLILFSIALLLALPFRDSEKNWNLAGPILLLFLLAQNFLLGSHPRYVLPFLPGIFLLALAGLSGRRSWPRPVAALLLAAALALLLRAHRGALWWEWGRIESAGVVIRQTIPKGALPVAGPATLHVRIASPVLPSGAGLEVLGEDLRPLPSRRETDASPVFSVSLPSQLLAENARRAVAISLRSTGTYDSYHFLLFPAVPPPWGEPCRREDSAELSPSTAIFRGSLDWWAHEGAP